MNNNTYPLLFIDTILIDWFDEMVLKYKLHKTFIFDDLYNFNYMLMLNINNGINNNL